MSNTSTLNYTELYPYLCQMSLRETPLMQRLRNETATLPECAMQIAPEQGQFMALLVKLINAKRIIEIGTFTGYSALCMAQALPADGHIQCCDVSEQWTTIAERYWQEAGVSEKINLTLQPALDTLKALREDPQCAPYDLAFIDADKTNYSAYFEHCLALIRPGGLILVDNVLWGGAVIDAANQSDDTIAIRAFNEAAHLDSRVDISLLPLADGLTLARKR